MKTLMLAAAVLSLGPLLAAAPAPSPRFAALVASVKTRVRQISPEQLRERQAREGARPILIDVRELDEWAAGRIPGARHVSRGVLERDIESIVPSTAAAIVVYCGAGSRSLLAADSLSAMGYADVMSLQGGLQAWIGAGYPVTRVEPAQGWPRATRELARTLILKYGEPAAWDVRSLTWENNRPWLRTVLYRQSIWTGRMRHEVLQQTVRYSVPRASLGSIVRFDPRLVVDRERTTLTMTSGDEETNVLALNLADQVVSGAATPGRAREEYRKALALRKSGKSSPLMETLRISSAKESPGGL